MEMDTHLCGTVFYPNWLLLDKNFLNATAKVKNIEISREHLFMWLNLRNEAQARVAFFEKPSDLYCLSCHMLHTSRSESCISILLQVTSNK